MEDLFEDKFEEAIGVKIECLSFLFSESEKSKEPILAWMKTNDSVWHRFFIDAWMPNWNSTNVEQARLYYETNNIDDYINEELEEYNDDNGRKWRRVDVLDAFDFYDKKIINAESTCIELKGLACTQLKIEIEGSNEIILNDYGDVILSELIINGTKLI